MLALEDQATAPFSDLEQILVIISDPIQFNDDSLPMKDGFDKIFCLVPDDSIIFELTKEEKSETVTYNEVEIKAGKLYTGKAGNFS